MNQSSPRYDGVNATNAGKEDKKLCWYTFYSEAEEREYYYEPKSNTVTWIVPDSSNSDPESWATSMYTDFSNRYQNNPLPNYERHHQQHVHLQPEQKGTLNRSKCPDDTDKTGQGAIHFGQERHARKREGQNWHRVLAAVIVVACVPLLVVVSFATTSNQVSFFFGLRSSLRSDVLANDNLEHASERESLPPPDEVMSSGENNHSKIDANDRIVKFDGTMKETTQFQQHTTAEETSPLRGGSKVFPSSNVVGVAGEGKGNIAEGIPIEVTGKTKSHNLHGGQRTNSAIGTADLSLLSSEEGDIRRFTVHENGKPKRDAGEQRRWGSGYEFTESLYPRSLSKSGNERKQANQPASDSMCSVGIPSMSYAIEDDVVPNGCESEQDNAAPNIFVASCSDGQADGDVVLEKRPKKCLVPFAARISASCRRYAREQPLFDLPALLDSMLE